MEFSVISSSHLQPNMITCGTTYGDLYVLDAFLPSYNRIDMAMVGRCAAYTALEAMESQQDQPGMTSAASYRRAHHAAEQITVERYNKLFRSGIRCIEFHPRLPSLSAVGLDDGSVHLLFVEGENLVIKKTLRLFTFNHPVDQLEWLLVKGDKTDGKLNPRPTSFVDRIWRILARASYHSLLIGRASKHVKVVRVEHNPRVFNFPSVVKAPRGVGKDEARQGVQQPRTPADRKGGKQKLDKSEAHGESGNGETEGEVVSLSLIRWPQPGYFEEELEYPTLTNFCLVQEALGVVMHHDNGVYMHIYTPLQVESNLKLVEFEKRIRLPIKGVPTAIQISPKQYNQMRRYLGTNNAHMFTLNGEKCLNALGEFIAIASDDGYVHVTSILHIYNRARAAVTAAAGKTNIANAANTGATEETANGAVDASNDEHVDRRASLDERNEAEVTADDRDNHSAPTNCGDSARYFDVEMASLNVACVVKCLRWGLLWNDYVRQPHLVAPDRCCCSDDIRFLLAAHTEEHVEVLQLAKNGGVLSLESSEHIGIQGSAVHWVEDTIPNDMTLMIATNSGLERFTWERARRTNA